MSFNPQVVPVGQTDFLGNGLFFAITGVEIMKNDDHYFALAERWANTLAQDDPRRRSTVVTRPNAPESRDFLDTWEAQALDAASGPRRRRLFAARSRIT